MKRKFAILLSLALVASMALTASASADSAGHGAPKGSPDYQLNIIGVPESNSGGLNDNNGRRIFVTLEGTTRIYLFEGDYEVLDSNGLDGRAEFQLPDPGFDEEGNSAYSVYIRALGQPGGKATITTCAELIEHPDFDLRGRPAKELEGQADAECSLEQVGLEVENRKGGKKFENVTQELLTMQLQVFVDDEPLEGACFRAPIFSDILEGEFWEYDNQGLRLAQVRFYDQSTHVELGEHDC